MLKRIWLLFKMTGDIKRFICLTILRCPFDFLYTSLQAVLISSSFAFITNRDSSGLGWLCVIFVFAFLLLFLYNGTVWNKYATFTVRFTAKLRSIIFINLCKLKPEIILAKNRGEWLSKFGSDTDVAAAVLNKPLHLPHFVVSAFSFTLCSVIMLFINPASLFIILILILPYILLNNIFIIPKISVLTKSCQSQMALSTEALISIISCKSIAVIYDAEELLFDKFIKASKSIKNIQVKIGLFRAINDSTAVFFGYLGYVLLIIYTGGYAPLSEVTAILQYRQGIIQALTMLTSCIINLRSADAGLERIGILLKD